jgi:hypothetical protein
MAEIHGKLTALPASCMQKSCFLGRGAAGATSAGEKKALERGFQGLV